ncbi:hypothetical protein [Hyalangium rubrum]|uniref:Uncharacterized protein n=1 Tax=Hyalangium rubrum TaxID=3103134 RepID=A0ABU5GWH4_9BACT|nr:hypothetical protein [Hyalangium sp. s54d21]MDY7225543.1 hypothetical protein [Hyalangium sp. s54d21]
MKVDGLMGPQPRMSTNLSLERQTQKRDFGARVEAGVGAAAGAVSSGVGMATGMFSGSGIVSAAVSSMSVLSSGVQGSTSTPYSTALPGGAGGSGGTGVPSLSTTVGGTGGVAIPGMGGSGGSSTNLIGSTNGTVGTEFNGELSGMFQEQKNLLKMQAQLQHEGQRFTAISNVMKTRHDTIKNSIGNIR